MLQLARTVLNSFSTISRQNGYLKATLPQLWFGTNVPATSEKELTALLQAKFPHAKVIQVEDASGGCGSMYNIYIETKEFKGISIAKQHQAVYAAIDEKIKLIHGVHVVTQVPP